VKDTGQLSQEAQADTIYVAVPPASDTSIMRIVSLPDPLRGEVRQINGGWDAIASLVLAAALLLVTIKAHLDIRGLHRVQAKLQQEYNDMEARHEADRRESEGQRALERRRAVDARISATAYAVRRQIRSWLDEAPDEVSGVVTMVDGWNDLVKEFGAQGLGEVPGITHGMLEMGRSWAMSRSGVQFDRAEARMLELAAAAPEASDDVAAVVRRGLVAFYNATELMNRLTTGLGPDSPTRAQSLTTAVHELEACEKYLDLAVERGRGRR
jgi:hypothetical protein